MTQGVQTALGNSNEPSIARRLLNLFQTLFPLLVMASLLAVWFATVRAEHGWEHFVLDLLLVTILLTVLFFAEALEIAYTFLSDKNRDEFKDAEGKITAEGKILDDIKKQPELVYEAREWLVIIIVVAITLTAEHDKIFVPLIGPIGDLPFSFRHWKIVISAHVFSLLFSLLFTTLPVIWFAQGPGKKIALSSAQQMLRWTRGVWWLVTKVGVVIDATGLNRPVEWISDSSLSRKAFGRKDSFSPSDQGFFLSCLQRYGFGLHDLTIKVQVHEDGSCAVTQKFVLYLVRHPRRTFYRQVAFEESEFAKGDFVTVRGYTLKAVGRKYDEVGILLDQIALGNCPANVVQSTEKHWDLPQEPVRRGKKEIGVRCGITTFDPVPSDIDGAFAFQAEWEGQWKSQAVRVANGIDDDFEVRVDYPCRRFSLTITPDKQLEMVFTEVKPKVTLMENPHTGEEERMRKALLRSPEGVHRFLSAELEYPLPGALYKYKWIVRRNH